MTTIAITATEIAADGKRLWGDLVCDLDIKKLRVFEGKVYAFTGTYPMFDPMMKWHQNGADPEKLPVAHDKAPSGWSLIVVSHNGIQKYASDCPYPESMTAPIAFGAGQDYAIGAMHHGATARDAIEIVSRICYHTGGEIQVINIAKACVEPIKEAAE